MIVFQEFHNETGKVVLYAGDMYWSVSITRHNPDGTIQRKNINRLTVNAAIETYTKTVDEFQKIAQENKASRCTHISNKKTKICSVETCPVSSGCKSCWMEYMRDCKYRTR